MRVVLSSDDRLVIDHDPSIRVGVLVLIELAFLGVLARYGWHLLSPEHLFWYLRSPGFLFVVAIALLIPIVIFCWCHWVRIVFDRDLECILIWRHTVGFHWEEKYPLADLRSVWVDEGDYGGRIVLSLTKKVSDYVPPSRWSAGLEKLAIWWGTPLQANDLPLLPYQTNMYDYKGFAEVIRSWAKVGRM